MSIKRGIDKAVGKVVDELKSMSKPTRDRDEIAQVGTISANNDKTIGAILAEAMDKVGKEGVITVEEAKGLETTLDLVEGMRFDRGYLSPYFVTDPERMECVYEDAYLLINEKKISSMKDLLPVLENVAKTGKPDCRPLLRRTIKQCAVERNRWLRHAALAPAPHRRFARSCRLHR